MKLFVIIVWGIVPGVVGTFIGPMRLVVFDVDPIEGHNGNTCIKILRICEGPLMHP